MFRPYATPGRPGVYLIALHRGFADALAAGLLARHGGDALELARGLVLLPNNRSIRAVRDAFVRRAGDGGLLLPRLVSLGDQAMDDAVGAMLDPIGVAAVPPAIDPLDRQLILSRLIAEAGGGTGRSIEAGEALRLAADLGRTLDQLIVAEVPAQRLREAVPAELAGHWQASLTILETVLARWPEELARRGGIDLAERRNRLMDAQARAWATAPPAGFVVAAGVAASGPATGRLLRVVSRLPHGAVVLAGLDTAMPEEEWQALREDEETHPQAALAVLLDDLGVARGEVRRWRGGGGGQAARTTAIGNAMSPARFTDKWHALPPRHRRLGGVRAIALPTPADEAEAIAVAMRRALETPGRTAALVTPDRALGQRVAARLARWNIAADDSAGRPLALTPPGTLLLAVAEAIAEDFAPVPLLALLKHPLVRAGDERQLWLDGARLLDRALRGPRPEPGLAGIDARLAEPARDDRRVALAWWRDVRPLLETADAAPAESLAGLMARYRTLATALAGDAAWARPAGHAAADILARIEASGEGPAAIDPGAAPAVLRTLLDDVAVRPPQGGHPRLFIWGLIEARLQQADLMILGGLNEGVWPAAPPPDPWLAPALRRALGLPGLERRIGLEAQEFAAGLAAPEVLLTRSRRDARAPTIPSRFWLRLEAMTGGIPRDPEIARWSAELDRPARFAPAARPSPAPPVADRPRRIAVTKLDRLQADPYAFYADAMLRLRRLDAVDADPSAAWRGTAVHAVLEAWLAEDDADPATLRPRAERMLAEASAHPVLRTLWTPRLLEAVDWIARALAEDRAKGRRPLVAEIKGRIRIAGLELEGTADRIDRNPDGTLAVVDYKTGKAPSRRAVAEGYAMQLGLLGLIAERGGFAGIAGIPRDFEYWSLSAARDGTLGRRDAAAGLDRSGQGVAPEDFTDRAARVIEAAAARWLTGDAPFVAKLHPEHAPYGDYDQLMRLDEWYGRAAAAPA